MEQFAGEGVEDEVDAFAIGFTHHVGKERAVSRIEDVLPWDAERFHEIASLLFSTNGNIDLSYSLIRSSGSYNIPLGTTHLGSRPLGYLNSSNTNTSTCRMYEYGLPPC